MGIGIHLLVIGFDIRSLQSLQAALLNEDIGSAVFRFAVSKPLIKEQLIILGQNLRHADITNTNILWLDKSVVIVIVQTTQYM